MTLRPLLLLALLAPALAAQDFRQLPGWAQPHALAGTVAPPAGDPDAWVLLDRTEFAYRGDGEIRKRNYRLVRILTERGLDQGAYVIHGLGGSASRVRSLKGWNLRPDGELVKLNTDFIVTVGKGAPSIFTSETATVGVLDRVAKGSFVAFESEEVITQPLGPMDEAAILEPRPIRRWELEMAKSVGWFTATSSAAVTLRLEALHFQPLFPLPVPGATALALSDVPALPVHESGAPHARNFFPRARLTFTDPSVRNAADLASWNSYAAWTCAQYEPLTRPFDPVDLGGRTGLDALRTIHGWMRRELAYKQVYLTPGRNWVPEAPRAVLRARFGDCKDLAALFIAAARGAGFEAVPVRALIVDGIIEPGEPVGPFSFNHIIAAVRLEASAGLPAEVATPLGRFLLVDLTERFTPLGRLGEAHRGGRVLICTDRGGAWVEIPEAAILPSRVEVRVEARETEAGGLKGTLELDEAGEGAGLRQLALWGGARAVKERCASLLGLPAGTRWDLAPLADPKEAGETFPLRIAFETSRGLVSTGTEWLLPRVGLPPSPSAIQRLGQPRVQPVHVPAGPAWDWRATLHLRTPRIPANPAAQLDTPFRSIRWTAEARDTTLTLRWVQTRRDAGWPYERREEGVQEQRADWKRFRVFLDEALTVVPVPAAKPAPPPPPPGPARKATARG